MSGIRKISKLDKVLITIGEKERLIYSSTDDEKEKHLSIKKEIETRYGLKTSSRDLMIKQIISLITQSSNNKTISKRVPFTILRTDIQNFFPSINKHILYQKLTHDNYLSNGSMTILKEFLFNKTVEGIPQGITFTSILAEIYLQDFDDEIVHFFNATSYFRYVDDILILLYPANNKRTSDEFLKLLDDLFQKHSLKINSEKTSSIFFDSQRNTLKFEYLGYQFSSTRNKSNNILSISITSSKYLKIWNKLYSYFAIYRTSQEDNINFWKLYYKLLNSLHGITSKNDKNQILKFGLAFSYRYIDDQTQLKKLIHQFSYEVHRSNLSSNKRFTLLGLVRYDVSPIEILQQRFDYTKLTANQLQLMHKRIGSKSNNISTESFFYHLYKT